ncbi:unnamed protein product [Nippostrongylus brasiliensis]|uniref:Uncharacterized protein n=1 Tax=Nippostrongylus brasiliensis TaxID=27835 RepID=A0A0N4YU86_NIPBR|nr:unnamed protein product [Nippostrongylus brasiliensis]
MLKRAKVEDKLEYCNQVRRVKMDLSNCATNFLDHEGHQGGGDRTIADRKGEASDSREGQVGKLQPRQQRVFWKRFHVDSNNQ